jgi:hypothetical protein
MAQPKRYFEGHRSKQRIIPHVNKTFNERFMEVFDTLSVPKITFNPTEPTNPQSGDLWIDTSE